MTPKRKKVAWILGALGLAGLLAAWGWSRGCGAARDGAKTQGGGKPSAARSSRPLVLVAVQGRLVDAEGKGVSGARVLVTRYGLGLALPEPTAVTDAEGRFEVVSSGGGTLDVDLVASRCARISRRFDVPLSVGGGRLRESPGQGLSGRKGPVHQVVDLGTLTCQPGGSLVGLVVDELGHGLPGALVAARELGPLGPAGQAFSAFTGRDGRFSLEHLALGRYEVSVGAPGYSTQVFESVEVPGRMGLVSLSPLAALSGVVTTKDGTPVAGAYVRIAGSGLWPGRVTDTDQEGRFHFRDLGQGIYDIEAWKGNRRSKPLMGIMVGLGGRGACPVQFVGQAAPAKGCPQVRLELLAGILVSGKVVEAGTGRPLSGARLVLGRGLLSSLALRAESDKQGSFQFQALLPGHYYLGVDRDGYLSLSTVRLEVHRGSGLSSPDIPDLQQGFGPTQSGVLTSIVRIVMDRGAGLEGQVVDDVGDPVVGAKISVVYAGRGLWVGTWSDRTEEVRRGLFERALAVRETGLGGNESLGVVPGPVPALPSAAGASRSAVSGRRRPWPGLIDAGQSRQGSADGGAARDAGPEVGSRDAGAADVGLLDAGSPDAAVVSAARPDRFVTDEQGRFRIQGLPPGRILLLVTHPKYAEARTKGLRLRVGKVLQGIRIVMRPGLAVEGRVDDDSGAPLAGVFVTVTDRLGLVVGRLTRTNRDGHFLLPNLAGKVRIRFERPGYLSLLLDMDLKGADRSRRIRVALKRADRVFEGWVTDPDDHPISGVLVETLSLDPSSPGRSAAITDGKGNFRVVGLGPVPYLVRLSHPDYPSSEFAHLDLSRKAHLVLHYGGGLEGVVRDRQTKALVPNVSARLVGPSGPARTKIFPDGRILWKGLSSGRYRLTLKADGYAPSTVTLKIPEADGPGEITVRDREWWLDTSGSLQGLVRDDRGFPVYRAEVWCERNGRRLGGGPTGPDGSGKETVLTDRKGRFVLTDLPVGPCLLKASHPDLGTGQLQAEVQPGPAAGEHVVDLSGKPVASGGKVVSGVAVQLVARGDDVVISRVAPGSKAEAAGLRAGDRLRSVDGQSVEGEGLSDLGARLQGPVGSSVVLEVERSGRLMSLPVEREMLPAGW